MRRIIAGLLLLTSVALQAQRTDRLEVRIEGLTGQVFLANYIGNRLFYNDTTVAGSGGELVFARAGGYEPGLYALLVNGKRCEVVLNEPLVRMHTDLADIPGHLVVEKSRENELYQQWKKVQQDPQASAALAEKNAGTLVAAMIRMEAPALHENVKTPEGTVDSTLTARAYRAHFWDGLALDDARMLHVPQLQNRFEEYLAVALPKNSDTVEVCVGQLLARTGGSMEIIQFLLKKTFEHYAGLGDLGMDAMYVHLARKYVCNEDWTLKSGWPVTDEWETVCHTAQAKAPLIIGAKAPNLVLVDTTEHNWIDMRSMTEEIVVVIFWSPTCPHCKHALPMLHEKYVKELHAKGVGVYAVADAYDSALFTDWKAFLREKKLSWVNVGLPWHVYDEALASPRKFVPAHTNNESLRYKETWKVTATPKYYVLDRERTIIGRPKSLDDLYKVIEGHLARSH